MWTSKISICSHRINQLIWRYDTQCGLLFFQVQSLDVTLPPATVVELPPVNMHGELISKLPRPVRARDSPGETGEGLRRRSSSKTHLYVSAEIGAFQHSLTTDLLNHLVFVQKSFMKVSSAAGKKHYNLTRGARLKGKRKKWAARERWRDDDADDWMIVSICMTCPWWVVLLKLSFLTCTFLCFPCRRWTTFFSGCRVKASLFHCGEQPRLKIWKT